MTTLRDALTGHPHLLAELDAAERGRAGAEALAARALAALDDAHAAAAAARAARAGAEALLARVRGALARDEGAEDGGAARVLAAARAALAPHMPLDADGASNAAAAHFGRDDHRADDALGAAFTTRGASNAAALVAGARVLYLSAAAAQRGDAPEAATVLKVNAEAGGADVDVVLAASGRVVNTVAARLGFG